MANDALFPFAQEAVGAAVKNAKEAIEYRNTLSPLERQRGFIKPGEFLPKNSDDLLEEARKYESADEFAKSKGYNIVFVDNKDYQGKINPDTKRLYISQLDKLGNKLPQEELNKRVAHEIGHLTDFTGGGVQLTNKTELSKILNERYGGSAGNADIKISIPFSDAEGSAYAKGLFLTNPNKLKKIAPETYSQLSKGMGIEIGGLKDQANKVGGVEINPKLVSRTADRQKFKAPIVIDGKEAGKMTYSVTDTRGGNQSLFVDYIESNEPGKGVGTDAMRKVIDKYPRVKEIYLEASPEASGFWKKLGATETKIPASDESAKVFYLDPNNLKSPTSKIKGDYMYHGTRADRDIPKIFRGQKSGDISKLTKNEIAGSLGNAPQVSSNINKAKQYGDAFQLLPKENANIRVFENDYEARIEIQDEMAKKYGDTYRYNTDTNQIIDRWAKENKIDAIVSRNGEGAIFNESAFDIKPVTPNKEIVRDVNIDKAQAWLNRPKKELNSMTKSTMSYPYKDLKRYSSEELIELVKQGKVKYDNQSNLLKSMDDRSVIGRLPKTTIDWLMNKGYLKQIKKGKI